MAKLHRTVKAKRQRPTVVRAHEAGTCRPSALRVILLSPDHFNRSGWPLATTRLDFDTVSD
jgi:hypothetical protein